MVLCALGRVASRIILPNDSLSMSVYVDAAGRPANQRVWGGLATFGTHEEVWLAEAVNELRKRNPGAISEDGELKGKNLDTSTIKATGRRIRTEDRQIVFWANQYPDWQCGVATALAQDFEDQSRSFRASKVHLEQTAYQRLLDGMSAYYQKLKGVNRWKFLSIVTHIQWLVNEIQRVRLGRQISSAELHVDRENFSLPSVCAKMLKQFFAAALQSVGMSTRTTGCAWTESPKQGAVRVDVDCDSRCSVGLQYVDILLQAVQRKLPGYERTNLSEEASLATEQKKCQTVRMSE